MLLGVPREIKDNEFRVGMTPAVAAELIHHGHSVLVETSAGAWLGTDFPQTTNTAKRARPSAISRPPRFSSRAEMVN